MLNLSASYFIRQLKDVEGLEELADHFVQLGLHSIDSDILGYTKYIAKNNNIKISSIHLPKLSPEDTRKMTEYLDMDLGVKRFTIHPERKTKEQFRYEWMPILKDLEKNDIKIAFENSNHNQSLLRNPYNIPEQKQFYLTLDVQHLPRTMDEMQVFEDLKEKILIVHLTDRYETKPYGRFNQFMTKMFKNPDIEYVLEYGRDHISEMKDQYRSLMRLYGKWSQDTSSQSH